MSLISGIGVDLIYIPRIIQLLKKSYGSRFAHRILSKHELSTKPKDISNPIFLARCWAIKEATFKALDEERQSGFTMKNWSTVSNSARPTVMGDLIRQNEKFLASVSHDGDYVFATVIRTYENTK
ncbi:hypothetical protein V1511DRAFT_511999 [Dipodascopsis uninucleata]